ncbi:MAG: helix-turn-helix transcriptional regulator [Anaerobutyricum hallii]|uniref:helix-turn-helix domain-containing protein n=1 Tax=Anaerobutyricum hallii TaxID=39488 RepID=UPI002A81F90C|nr:helix-turn-helix transcriptional regulator [Anaerobutyricum hallii]MDY4576585.1 helix-turn-helix transcriptional regulator [Anaerobutyricum hallii]
MRKEQKNMPVLMKELRTHLKLSLNKFAAPLEISSGYIKRVEDGRTVPSQKVLDSIVSDE